MMLERGNTMRFYPNDDRELINVLNNKLGMHHRSDPYDLNNAEDVKDALTKLIAEFTDYASYSNSLEDILEQLDESIEYYDPIAYIHIASGFGTGDALASNTYYSLRSSLVEMRSLENRAKTWCEELLSLVLTRPLDFQISIFGKGFLYDPKRISDLISEASYSINEYNIENSFDAFVDLMNQTLESN